LSNRNKLSLLADLVDALERCVELVREVSLQGYVGRDDVTERVNWNLVVAGEAANVLTKIDREIIAIVPEIDRLVSLRNRIAHGYFAIDDVVIWNTVKSDIPNVLSDLRQLMERLSDLQQS
jgi:uncharacterized protein with HEPN domain